MLPHYRPAAPRKTAAAHHARTACHATAGSAAAAWNTSAVRRAPSAGRAAATTRDSSAACGTARAVGSTAPGAACRARPLGGACAARWGAAFAAIQGRNEKEDGDQVEPSYRHANLRVGPEVHVRLPSKAADRLPTIGERRSSRLRPRRFWRGMELAAIGVSHPPSPASAEAGCPLGPSRRSRIRRDGRTVRPTPRRPRCAPISRTV